MFLMRNVVFTALASCLSFAGSTVAASTLPSEYQSSKDQYRVETACRSSLPVLVIDSFPTNEENSTTIGGRKANIDIDGDDTPDVFHGELVEQLVRVSGHTTERVNLSEMSSLPDIYELLLPIVVGIERGELHYSRINISQESPLRLAAFKKDLFPEDSSFPEITSENIGENSKRILEKLWSDRPDLKIQELDGLFARLEKSGVPVIVAAGNFGPRFVNLFSMLPGVTSVGSLEVTGQKLFTSSDNFFVTAWMPGVVVPTEVPGGMDIDGDTKPEFLEGSLSNGPAIVAQWIGQPVDKSVTMVDPKFIEWIKEAATHDFVVSNAAVNIIDKGLYLTEDLVELPTVTSGTRDLFRSLGTYAFKLSHSAPRYFFEVTTDGALKYDPKRDGTPNQRTRIGGTSFAAPRICAGR